MNVIIAMLNAIKLVKMKLVATIVCVGLVTNLIQIFTTAQVCVHCMYYLVTYWLCVICVCMHVYVCMCVYHMQISMSVLPLMVDVHKPVQTLLVAISVAVGLVIL